MDLAVVVGGTLEDHLLNQSLLNSHIMSSSLQICRYYFGHEFLVDVVNKICNNVRGINRVCQDITS